MSVLKYSLMICQYLVIETGILPIFGANIELCINLLMVEHRSAYISHFQIITARI